MDSTDERKDDGGKGERQEKRGRKDGGKVDQEKKRYWKETYLEEEDFHGTRMRYACMERIKVLKQGDERQRKIEELEEEAGTNKQIYETLWGLARQSSEILENLI
eukprot:g31445.t1